MEFGRAIRFPVDNEGWVSKVLIGIVVSLVPILNWAVYGYALEVTRRVTAGDAEELPPWDRVGRFVARGFAMSVAGFLYALPGLLLFLLFAIGGAGESTLTLAGGILYAVYGIVVAFILPVAFIRYAVTDRWFTMFDFGWVFNVTGQNFGSLLAIYIVWLLLAIVLVTLGTIVLFVGALVASFWSTLILFHLLGQVGARTVPARTVSVR